MLVQNHSIFHGNIKLRMNISENNFGRAKLDMFLGPFVLRENILLPLFELHLGKCRLSTPESFKMRGGFPHKQPNLQKIGGA